MLQKTLDAGVKPCMLSPGLLVIKSSLWWVQISSSCNWVLSSRTKFSTLLYPELDGLFIETSVWAADNKLAPSTASLCSVQFLSQLGSSPQLQNTSSTFYINTFLVLQLILANPLYNNQLSLAYAFGGPEGPVSIPAPSRHLISPTAALTEDIRTIDKS